VRRSEGYYEQGFVCGKGHLLTSFGDSQPDIRSDYCPDCGEAVFGACPECGETIRGHYRPAYPLMDIINGRSEREPPAYCHSCGKPYPWTSARLGAAKELVSLLDELSDDDKRELNESLIDIATDGPRTEVGVLRVRSLLRRAGKETGRLVYKVAVDVASEAAKKALTGGL
jgi:hypothetical protein